MYASFWNPSKYSKIVNWCYFLKVWDIYEHFGPHYWSQLQKRALKRTFVLLAEQYNTLSAVFKKYHFLRLIFHIFDKNLPYQVCLNAPPGMFKLAEHMKTLCMVTSVIRRNGMLSCKALQSGPRFWNLDLQGPDFGPNLKEISNQYKSQ